MAEEGIDRIDRAIRTAVEISERGVELFELLTGVLLVGLFAVGFVDLVRAIVDAVQSGSISQVETVIGFIDTVLLLLIIAEVFRTVVAFARDESVVQIIIDAALVAVIRKIIIFRPDKGAPLDSLLTATSSVVLLLALILAFLVVRTAFPSIPDDAGALSAISFGPEPGYPSEQGDRSEESTTGSEPEETDRED